jgi:hypothetical protein
MRIAQLLLGSAKIGRCWIVPNFRLNSVVLNQRLSVVLAGSMRAVRRCHEPE